MPVSPPASLGTKRTPDAEVAGGDEDVAKKAKTKSESGKTPAATAVNTSSSSASASKAGMTASPAPQAAETEVSKSSASANAAQPGMTAPPGPQPGLTAVPGDVQVPTAEDIVRGTAISTKEWARAAIPVIETDLLRLLGKMKLLQHDGALWQQAPLVIEADSTKNLKNFKEQWNWDNCVKSCNSTGMYEASGNLFWLAASRMSDENDADTHVSWPQVQEARSNWSESALQASSSEPRVQRYEFPGVYLTSLDSIGQLDHAMKLTPPYLKGVPLHVGHALVWSWYLAVSEAMACKQEQRVMKLYEAALTITLRLRLRATAQESIIDSIVWSEAVRLKHVACSYTFLSFAAKVLRLPGVDTASSVKMEQSLAVTGLTFQNTPLSKQKCLAVLAFKPILGDAEAWRVLHILGDLAPSLLHEYTKLMRMAQCAQKLAAPGQQVPVFTFCVEALISALRQVCVKADDIKDTWLVGTKTTQGFMQAAATRRHFVNWLRADIWARAAKMPADERKQLDKMLHDAYGSPLSFDSRFVYTYEEDGERCVDTEKRDAALESLHAGLTAPWLKALSKFLFLIYTFTFETEFGQLCQETQVQFSTFCFDSTNASQWSLVEAYQQFFEVYASKPVALRPDETQDEVVDASDTANVESAAAASEREDIWARALKRKSNIEFHALRDNPNSLTDAELYNAATGGKLQRLYNSSEAKKFRGGAQKDSYRLLLLNAECFNFSHQAGKSDLHKRPVPMCDEIDHALAWLAKQRDDRTVIMAMDGRSQEVRRAMDAWLHSETQETSKVADIWVTYESHGGDVRVPKRKIAFASRNREVWFVMLPLQRKYFRTHSRSVGTAGGEETTHANTYTRVKQRPLSALPRLILQAKKDMIGRDVLPASGRGLAEDATAGHPLFWQDVKTVSFLSSVFHDFNIGFVFDLSPGCGTAAIACAQNGIGYDGVCANAKHMKWVSGLLDMAILAVEADPPKGKTSADEPYIQKIKQYFGTTVAEAKRMLRDEPDDTHAVDDPKSTSSDDEP